MYRQSAYHCIFTILINPSTWHFEWAECLGYKSESHRDLRVNSSLKSFWGRGMRLRSMHDTSTYYSLGCPQFLPSDVHDSYPWKSTVPTQGCSEKLPLDIQSAYTFGSQECLYALWDLYLKTCITNPWRGWLISTSLLENVLIFHHHLDFSTNTYCSSLIWPLGAYICSTWPLDLDLSDYWTWTRTEHGHNPAHILLQKPVYV